MDIGVFIPIGNNGWLISTTSPQYMPTFELNKQIVLKAEYYGLKQKGKINGESFSYSNLHSSVLRSL